MENIVYPDLDIPYSELQKIFYNAQKDYTSWDPEGRREMQRKHGIRDRWQCSRVSYLTEEIIENVHTISQKIIIKKPSEELLEALLRNGNKMKRLKHYKNILYKDTVSDKREIDFTRHQLPYRGDIVFGERISELSLEEMVSVSEIYEWSFIEKYELLKSNVIMGIAGLFSCSPDDVRVYLKTQKFKLVF